MGKNLHGCGSCRFYTVRLLKGTKLRRGWCRKKGDTAARSLNDTDGPCEHWRRKPKEAA